MDIAQAFKGMETAKLNGKGQKLGPGSFDVEIEMVKGTDGHFGQAFIVEMKVVAVGKDNPKNAKGELFDPIDCKRTFTVALKRDQAFGDIKAFCLAVAGVDPSSVKPPAEDPEMHKFAANLARAALSPEAAKDLKLEANWTNGKRVHVDTHGIKTKENRDFVIHRWSPIGATPDPANGDNTPQP